MNAKVTQPNTEVKDKASKVLGFDSQVYAKGIGKRWGHWAGAAGAAVAATGTYFLRSKPEGFFASTAKSARTPFAMVGAAVVAWFGVGIVGKVIGKHRGTKEANEIKQEFLQTLAENEGLKRENSVLKETSIAEARSGTRFTDSIASRMERGGHTAAAEADQSTAQTIAR